MDKVAQITSSASLEALKEPRGLLRVIQFIIAIFAFATTTSHSSKSSFQLTCSGGVKTQDISFGYPFNLESATFPVPICNATKTGEEGPYGSMASSAEFYVFVGVMAFLYSLASLVLYIGFDDLYRKNDNIPIVDFIVSLVFTLLWLISSSAWAQGLTDLKFYSNPDEMFFDRIKECGGKNPLKCETTNEGNFAGLNVSIIFGFLNMLVWGANLWFLFKETKWFKVRQSPPAAPTSPSEEPQRV